MSAISTYLQRILNAIWARDVRQAIHDAISQCYDDVNAPALQTDAMQRAVQAKIDAGQMAALTIADGSLTGAKLANGTIPTAKLADNSVSTSKIIDNSVTEAKLADGSITTDKLANKAVTTAKLDDGSVTWQKLASGAVHTGELADGAVTGAKLADGAVTAEKIASGVVPAVDATLAQTGAAADAKVVGDEIADLKEDLSETLKFTEQTLTESQKERVKENLDITEGLSDEAKTALLALLEKVAFFDEAEGRILYNNLFNALNGSGIESISASFDNSAIVYTTDTLESIRQYVTVIAHYENGSDRQVSDYTLTGSLNFGISTITATYQDKTASFNVTVRSISHWSTSDSHVKKLKKSLSGNAQGASSLWVLSDPTTPTRTCAVVDYNTGAGQFVDKNSGDTGYYPFPVPNDATGFQISLSDSSQSVVGYLIKYDSGNNFHLVNISDAVWHTGNHVSTGFTSDSNLYLAVSIKKTASQSISDLTIDFT